MHYEGLKEAYVSASECTRLTHYVTLSPEDELLWAVSKLKEDLAEDFNRATQKLIKTTQLKDGRTLAGCTVYVVPYDTMARIITALEVATNEARTRHRDRQRPLEDLGGGNT